VTDAGDIRYIEIGGDLYPADRVGPDGQPLPITEEQARAIADVLAEEYETNAAFRAIITAKASTTSLTCSPASPLAGEPPKGVAA